MNLRKMRQQAQGDPGDRSRMAMAEVAAIMKKYNCRMDIHQDIVIIPLDPRPPMPATMPRSPIKDNSRSGAETPNEATDTL